MRNCDWYAERRAEAEEILEDMREIRRERAPCPKYWPPGERPEWMFREATEPDSVSMELKGSIGPPLGLPELRYGADSLLGEYAHRFAEELERKFYEGEDSNSDSLFNSP